MNESILYRTDAWLICLLLAIGMLAAIYIGNKVRKYVEHRKNEFTTIESAVLALFGLLLAFTFGMAGSRYDARRGILVKEANNIGTAILRADMYNDSAKIKFRYDFKKYVDARIALYEAGRDDARKTIAKQQSDEAATNLWMLATTLSKQPGTSIVASNQMIPALNDMFDITVTNDATLQSRVPDSIMILLFIMAFVSSFLVGFSIPSDKKMDWLSVIGFTLLTVTVIFVIIDLDRPTRGFIKSSNNIEYIKSLNDMFK